MSLLGNRLLQMFSRELSLHGRTFVGYEALKTVKHKHLSVDGLPSSLFFNPGRVASVMAKVDEETLAHRQCFLCPEGLGEDQQTCDWKSSSGNRYWIRINPFPIFSPHFTISISRHERQQMAGHYADMLELSKTAPEFLFFYNGPMCGASAPDHQHFQAIGRGSLPVENMVDQGEGYHLIANREGVIVSKIDRYVEGAFLLQSPDPEKQTELFYNIVSLGEIRSDKEWEPRMNVITWYREGVFNTVIFFRAESRPDCFWSKDPASQILISPGAVEMSGVAIVSSLQSYDALSQERLGSIIKEVSISRSQSLVMEKKLVGSDRPQAVLSVGIVSLPEVAFVFNSPYKFNSEIYEGEYRASFCDGKIVFAGQLFDEITFSREDPNGSFELKEVVIGVGFHWERRENQVFAGDLKLIVENDRVTAVNMVGIEDYLLSVISSEMSATASKNLLKAHAVISRSWLLAQIERNRSITAGQTPYSAFTDTEEELIKWYDREDHANFDVCADDHCQRYQGLSRATTRVVREVIDETWGEVLKYDGEICDARFSKCCGGVMEEFGYAWESKSFLYLTRKSDRADQQKETPDLTVEANAREWILSSPEAFCNTADKQILAQVLNSYDRETRNFYRWRQEYTVEELSSIVRDRTGEDYGEIIDLIPVARGVSGRLWKLKIVGTKNSRIIGKELEIRRTLSRSHLYSSAFVVEKKDGRFILSGAGWGHGVGLCQIGAAVMGEKGYTYDKILSHYFPGSTIEKQY